MNLTSLFAGPAPAGPSPSAATGAGAGHLAGPAPADAAGSGDFASLVDLALEQIAGTPADEAPICGTSASHADGEAADETGAEPASGEPAGAIDDLTLAVQLALAQPVTAAVPAVEVPVVTGGGIAAAPDLTAIEPASTGSGVEAIVGDAQPIGAPAVAAGQTPASAAAFAEALGAAVAEAPAGDAAPVHTPESQAAAIEPIAPPQPATAAAAAAPAATSTPAPAAAGADAAARHRAPQGAKPALHRALAALAAQGPADSTAAPAANPGTQAGAASSPAHAASPAEPVRSIEAPARAAAVAGLAEGAVARVAERGRAAAGEASADTASDAQPFGPVALAPHAAAVVAAPDAPFAAPQASTAIPPANAAMLQAGFAVPVPVPSPSADASLALELPAATARFEQTLAALDPDVRNLQSMVRTVRLFTSSGVSEARLQLEPDHLGPVALTVRIEQGTVSAHFRAETPAAQRWIETHQQELRSGLREQGLEVKDVVVTTDPDARRDRRQEPQPARAPRTRRAQADADAPRFEVLV